MQSMAQFIIREPNDRGGNEIWLSLNIAGGKKRKFFGWRRKSSEIHDTGGGGERKATTDGGIGSNGHSTRKNATAKSQTCSEMKEPVISN